MCAADLSAEKDADNFSENDIGETCAPCQKKDQKTLALIPRKSKNIFDADKYVKVLLPDRYPPKNGVPIKDIEFNYYPDLNMTRTITAVVTEKVWSPQCDRRPEPKAGVTVYFILVQLGVSHDTFFDAESLSFESSVLNVIHSPMSDLNNL